MFFINENERCKMKNRFLYSLSEMAVTGDYCIASYYLELPGSVDPYEKAKNMAVGQTIGTWLPIPGITDDMREKYMGKIVNIIELDPSDLVDKETEEKNKGYIFQIAYPTANFENRIPLLITTLLGNDASTSVQAKLLDLHIPQTLANEFPGPAYGIDGIRQICKIEKRPMLLNMIKPCLGFPVEKGADIFYQSASGGVDFIKDDELLGNIHYCPLRKRIKAYQAASDRAFEETGKRTFYIPNITDHIGNLIDNAKEAEDADIKIVMVNFASIGLGALQMLRENTNLAIFAHYAGAGPYYEGAKSGMSSDLILGKLARMCGADVVMLNTPYGGYPLKKSRYRKTAHQLTLPFYSMKPALPSLGGGVNPGMVHILMEDLGNDIMLAPGGAIQGHPLGIKAGVKAMYDAIEAEMQGQTIEKAVEESKELKAGEYMWKDKIESYH